MTKSPRLWDRLSESMDFVRYEHKAGNDTYFVGYYRTLVDLVILQDHILEWIGNDQGRTLESLFPLIPIAVKELTSDRERIESKLLQGYVAVQRGGSDEQCLLVQADVAHGRSVTKTDNEFTVEGPKEAFVEMMDVNLNMVRRRLPVPELRIKEVTLGSLSKTKLAVCYIDGITNEQLVDTCMQRLQAIEFDIVPEITVVQQLIEDRSNSIFPQLFGTQRPDRVSWSLGIGQVCVFLDGSPTALVGPANLGFFFTSYEDYFLPWIIGSVLRLVRMAAVVFSVLASSLYVAIMTYHGQSITNTFLPTIVSSRIGVPFPPFVEVMIMELVITLLYEAGSRLPSKIGQTIGIVGGIVLGTAAVEAALTSNFLLIIVAMAALASFTTPVFRMSSTIRTLRFPFIVAAQVWGLLGIAICGVAVVIHLLRLTSFGMPYLVPYYPYRQSDFADSIIRAPYSKFHHRPSFLRTRNPVRFDRNKAKLKNDIDE
ncbi:spore germination protein [Cohnella sp. GCM10027633]|uniref:spore germination protein n=1 Tax=unclassified Cohnella TaxID=2636738 RepID=UPI003634E42E